MSILRTPDERFLNLPDFPFRPNYVEIGGARVHYLDEGGGEVITFWSLSPERQWMEVISEERGWRCQRFQHARLRC
jgi:haloalkane dehalogenase